MADRPIYRYADAELAEIRGRMRNRDRRWIHAVWDPILLKVHGLTTDQLADRNVVWKPGDYGIPWDQSSQISRWLGELPRGTGMPFEWLNYGPSPVKLDEALAQVYADDMAEAEREHAAGDTVTLDEFLRDSHRNPLAEQIGPMWTDEDVTAATGMTVHELDRLAAHRLAVRLPSSDGTSWWPRWQFDDSQGRVGFAGGVQRLWRRLPEGTFSDWDLAAWMARPRRDFDGLRPIDLAGRDDWRLQAAVEALIARAAR